MKNITPQRLSALLAGLSAAGLLALLLILNKVGDQSFGILVWFSIPIFTLILVYFLSLYYIERFIYRKIKLLYKIIHQAKTGRSSLRTKLKEEENILEHIEEEVESFTTNKAREIENLKAMEEYRSAFLSNVSHELKTPIFIIQGYIETLLDGAIKDEKVNRSYLQKASRNLDRLEHIVQDLLNINQLESGNNQLDLKKFDIHQLTNECFEDFEMRADLKDIKLTFKPDCDKSFPVYSDPKLVRDVLDNLVFNAIKYINEGDTVSIGFYDMDEMVLVEVADNGPGIDEDHLPRLFERFYRLDNHRSRDGGGTGLGLAIVKHIMESLGQTINVRSTKGVGTTFAFTLAKRAS